jgi:hypothetical protein
MATGDFNFDPRANSDREIRHVKEDRLGRAPFARRVAARIAASGELPSIVYGLAGPWGGGKSSVLNMIDELLTEEHGQKWTVVRFTPWAAADVEALTDEFYGAIAGAMPRDEAGKRAKALLIAATPVAMAALKAAAKALIESKLGKDSVAHITEATSDKLADELGEISVDPDPFAKRFSKLSEAIKEAGRNILVIVDDIDRLHTDELLTVMKAVRLLGRFDHVHYLLSYDENTVLDVLQGSNLVTDRNRARQYIEKIVQYPFVLPPLDPVDFETELTKALTAVAKTNDIELSPDLARRRGTISSIIDTIPDIDVADLTIRFIYRFAGQVDTVLTLVGKDDLNFVDASLITYLRMRYHTIYEKLPRWRSDLVSLPPVGTARGTTELTQEAWRERINDALGPGFQNSESILRLLGVMFPRVQRLGSPVETQQRIFEPDYFPRYFAYRIPVDDVSDSKVRGDFTTLVTTGSSPSGSVFAENLNSARGRSLIRRKALRNLDVLANALPDAAAEGAYYLAGAIDPSDDLVGGWGVVLYAILGHAICNSEGVVTASEKIGKFEDGFGLLRTVNVLSTYNNPVAADIPGLDPAKIIEASAVQRAEVLAACEKDLSEDVTAEDSSAFTVLHFVRYLDDDLWGRLSVFAINEIREGRKKPYELAARFVVIRPISPSLLSASEGYLQFFQKVVPRENWDFAQIPDIEESEIPTSDTSLSNREKFAAFLMKREESPAPTDGAENRSATAREDSGKADEPVPWRLTYREGDVYELWNDSESPKFHVQISGEGVVGEKTVDRIDGRSSVEFMGLSAAGVGNQVVVTWHRLEDRSDAQGRWAGTRPRKS